MSKFILPSKILPSLRYLNGYYKSEKNELFHDIIEYSKITVIEEVSFDNWNGGMTGHDVIMYLPERILIKIKLENKNHICNQLKDDINGVNTEVNQEYINSVHLKLQDADDPQFEKSIPFTDTPTLRPVDVGLWDGDALRLFISHRDLHKAKANELAEALRPFGICSFVAHDAIKPMNEWQKDIENGLKTMEVMLIFLTDDFHESNWTNQEVGFALGKGVPIVCLKLGNKDPQGFIGSQQALKASYDDISFCASNLYRLLTEKINSANRLHDILIEQLISSVSYTDAMDALRRLQSGVERINETQLKKIAEGYSKNSQLYGCGGIHTNKLSLEKYLNRATNKTVKFDNRKILFD